MFINGIGAAGCPGGYGTKRTQFNTTGKSFAEQVNRAAGVPRTYQVYIPEEDTLYSGGNGTGLSFYLKYAEDSTEDDPTVIARGVDENGDEFEQTIHINKINPRCATYVEMRALEAHLGVEKNGGLTSLPMGETGNMGLHGDPPYSVDPADLIADGFRVGIQTYTHLVVKRCHERIAYGFDLIL